MDRSTVSSKAEYWQRVLVKQRLRRPSVAAFCDQNSISAPSFHQWQKKFRPPQPLVASPTFVPICVIPAATPISEKPIQIMTPSGFSLCCNMPSVDARKLTQIIEAIQVAQRGEEC